MKYILIAFSLIFTQLSYAQVREFTLEDIIRRAQEQSPSAKQAETRKENNYWQYRLHKSNYNPLLDLNGTLPDYNRDYFSNRLDDGTVVFQGREQMNSDLALRIQQPLYWTGGRVSINSNMNRVDDLERDETRYNSTIFNIMVTQPLFAFNGLKWDRVTKPMSYEESKRTYVEEMESISSTATNRFFSYIDAQINLQIAEYNYANNDTIYKIEEGRYNIGTTSKDKLLQAELQLLRSRKDISQAKLDLETASLQLRSYIGLKDTEQFKLILPEDIPEFEVDYTTALEQARNNRADYLAFERRKLEAEIGVRKARADRFQMDVTASFGVNNASDTGIDDIYHNPNNQQRIKVSFNIPIMDWGRTKASMQTALANQRLQNYIIAQDELNFEEEVLTQVRQFEMLYTQVEITKKSDLVAQDRYNVAQNRYLIGKIDITNLNIALTEKDQAKRSYLSALRSFWAAYYTLRRLTLYDFADKKLLYIPEE